MTSKYKKQIDKKIKSNQNNSRKKNNSPKIYSKSPTYQVNHQIKIIKQNNKNISIVINDELNKKEIKRAIKDFNDMQKDFSKRIDVKAKIYLTL